MGILILLLSLSLSSAHAETGFEATARLAGTYKGEWSTFAVDSSGQVFEKSKWVDVLVEENPRNDKERPVIEATNTVTFPNGRIIVSRFLEGFYTNSDGEAGDRYVINHDMITTYTALDRDTWVFQFRPSDPEIEWLGFDPAKVTTASHVIIRSRSYAADGNETYQVTRITAIQWHDSDGKEFATQFVSLKGFHKRVKN